MKPILVVDDDPQMRAALKEAIIRLGYEVLLAQNGREGISILAQYSVAMVITDMKMPGMDGLTFLKEANQNIGRIPFLVITGYGTVENAVEVMKEGAYEYLMKPFSFETLSARIGSLMERFSGDRRIITENAAMKKLLQVGAEVAPSDTTVLVYGESGTGKELLARYIHGLSGRRQRSFIAVNCAAIPDNLMESELFGYEKGAFTGAAERKIGKFELASGGTILLDEIGEMSIGLQAKLLRVLQEKEVDRVGGRRPVPVDVRVIVTTNRDLYLESAEGRFREDLYYRLSVLPLFVPPLRERPEDISLLSGFFLKKFAGIFEKKVQGFSAEAAAFLAHREWRGNIRELENAVQRATLLCRGEMIEVRDFMITESAGSQAGSRNGIRDMERDLIFKTLKETRGNKALAARLLGVSVRTIRNKLNSYGRDAAETAEPEAVRE